jgi:eukaryotic-like serine/threonine-protein kinase
MLTPDQWQKVRDVLEQALKLPPEKRSRFLDVACSSDPTLRSEVQSLLSADEQARTSLLEAPSVLPAALSPSTRLGDYEILSQIGSGGMGVVYRARDTRLGRDVAIKVLPAHVPSDANRLKRFEQEAQSAAALNHPNILAVYQLGSYQDAPYLVSELLEGETLREQLKQGQLSQERALDYAQQIADGLTVAHERGIIHRDLKPENLFVTKDNRIKILDFGLAKLVEGDGDSAETVATLGLQTHPGMIAGTVSYMSPEQVRGEKLDTRTDLFSFGVLMYEMATGQRPFEGGTSGVAFEAILNRQPTPPTKLNSKVAPGLENIITKALEKDREVRYQHASDIRADLKRLKRDTESGHTSAPLTPTPKNGHTIYWLVPIAVLALIALAIFVYKRTASHIETKKQMVIRDLTASSTGGNTVAGAVVSPDGTQLALADIANGLSLFQISTGATRVLDNDQTLSPVSWYPDGANILATSGTALDHVLWRVSAFDGKKQRLLADQTVHEASVSPDGRWIAFAKATAPGKIWIMGPNGENPVEVPGLSAVRYVGNLAWSPTSRRLLYVSQSVDRQGAEKLAISSCDRESGHEIEVVSSPDLRNPAGLSSIYWSWDGRVLYTFREPPPNTGDSNIWALPVDPDSGQVRGVPSRITNFTGFGVGELSESKNGKALVFGKVRSKDSIFIANIDGVSQELRNIKALSSKGWSASTPMWTHDGRKLAFYSAARGEFGFYIEDLASQEIQPLITGLARKSQAAFTSDEKWLLFTQPHSQPSADDPFDLLRMPFDGGPASPLLTGNVMVQCALRAADCVFAEVKDDRGSFFQLDPIKGRGALLAQAQKLDFLFDYDWSLSSDGRSIAYLPKHNGNQIAIFSMEGKSSRTVTVDGGYLQSPAWAADNQHLYVVSKQRGHWNLLYVESSGKYKIAQTSPLEVWIVSPRASPDGDRLAFQQRSYESNYAMLEDY